ncbi:MAG TPA: class I SAM-dependent methyltransferase, partial [Candidatus Bathyarchaeia archaeon]|nr:class I SAM-dependent methyltransferase [Candidatus Bathyarchaeia archaeon]
DREVTPTLLRVSVADVTGATVAATDKPSHYFQTEREYWQGLDSHRHTAIYLTDVRYDEQSRLYYVTVTYPVLQEGTGRFIGAVTALVDLSPLFTQLTRQQVARTGHLFLVRDDGTVIQAPGVTSSMKIKSEEYGAIRDDKIVSVGMFEHVGEALLPEYFQRAWDLLRSGGVFLNQGIAQSAIYRRRGASFTDRYVFPDGDLVPLSTSLRAAELAGFEVRDVESLREHYPLTPQHWVRRLESRAAEARRVTNDTIYRIWRLYMAGSAHAFRTGRLKIYQTLLSKPSLGRSDLPRTRDDWHRIQT